MDEDGLEHVGEHVLDLVHVLLEFSAFRHQHLQSARTKSCLYSTVFCHRLIDCGDGSTSSPRTIPVARSLAYIGKWTNLNSYPYWFQ